MSSPVALDDLDLSLAAMLAGLAMAEEVERRIAAAGYGDARFAHGFVFQHLLREPLTVGALARAMGVTQQRASKAASELEDARLRASRGRPVRRPRAPARAHRARPRRRGGGSRGPRGAGRRVARDASARGA